MSEPAEVYIYVFDTLYVSWFNLRAQTPLVEHSKAMMCLLYETKRSPSHMITGSRGVVYPTMKLFSLMLATTLLKVIK